MAVIAVVGAPGAPGATTSALALLLAWPLQPGRRILLVECDPDGGAVLAGALEGRVEAVYGLRNLAVADRRGLLAQGLWEQLIDLSPAGNAERLLLPGLTDPTQAPGLAYTWEPLMEVLHGLEPQGYDVILDLGRSGATGTSAVLARRADVVAAAVRTTLRGLSAARPRLATLAEDLTTAGTGADALGLLLIAEGPYSGAEVSKEFGLPVLGLLPHARRTAQVLSDGGDVTDRRFVRSELMRTARSAADEIQLTVHAAAPAARPGGGGTRAARAGDGRRAGGGGCRADSGPRHRDGRTGRGPAAGRGRVGVRVRPSCGGGLGPAARADVPAAVVPTVVPTAGTAGVRAAVRATALRAAAVRAGVARDHHRPGGAARRARAAAGRPGAVPRARAGRSAVRGPGVPRGPVPRGRVPGRPVPRQSSPRQSSPRRPVPGARIVRPSPRPRSRGPGPDRRRGGAPCAVVRCTSSPRPTRPRCPGRRHCPARSGR